VPEPVKRNLLDVALWVFSFNLPDFFGLRGIAKFAPFKKLTRDQLHPWTINIFGTV
jgi:hypothetical protein